MEIEIYLVADEDGEVLCAFTNKEQCITEAEEGCCNMQSVRLVSEEDPYIAQLSEALKHMLELSYKLDCPKELLEEYGNAYANYSNLIQRVNL